MKLSECVRIGCAITGSLADAIAALEADLADANARAMELTARCDRMRVERDDANARAANGGLDDFDEAYASLLATSRVWEERAYAAVLVYEMREHALQAEAIRERTAREIGMGVAQGELNRRDEKSAKFHRRAQAAESRAIKVERESATLRVRLQGAIREMTAERLRVWAEIAHEHGALPTTDDYEARTDRMLAERDKNATTKRPFVQRNAVLVEGPLPEFPRDADLARRRVTELAEGPSLATMRIATLEAECTRRGADIAERDARIAELERERDDFERALALHATHLVRRSDGKRMFRGVHSEDEIATTGGMWEFGRTTIAETARDEAIARAERAERLVATAEDRLDKAKDVLGLAAEDVLPTRFGPYCEDTVLSYLERLVGKWYVATRDLAEAIARAERLRATIARIREICEKGAHEAAYDLRADIMAEIGGEA